MRVVKRGVVEGFHARGKGIDRDLVRSVWIPLASPSSLRDVAVSRRPRIGPVGNTRSDAIFISSVGGRRGDAVLVPCLVGSSRKVVAILYGDDLIGPPPSVDLMMTP